MSLFIGSEVILANLLNFHKKDEGITLQEIINYCEKLKSELIEKKDLNISYIYLNVNPNELDNTILKYNNEFRKFQDKYYLKRPINVRYFNSIFLPEIATIIEKVAQSIDWKKND